MKKINKNTTDKIMYKRQSKEKTIEKHRNKQNEIKERDSQNVFQYAYCFLRIILCSAFIHVQVTTKYFIMVLVTKFG